MLPCIIAIPRYGSDVVPHVRTNEVLRDALPGGIHHTRIELRLCVSRFSRPSVPRAVTTIGHTHQAIASPLTRISRPLKLGTPEYVRANR